jgi:hypothetical protein
MRADDTFNSVSRECSGAAPENDSSTINQLARYGKRAVAGGKRTRPQIGARTEEALHSRTLIFDFNRPPRVLAAGVNYFHIGLL